MQEVTRDEISAIMHAVVVDGATPKDRNQQRRNAVEEFLSSKPNYQGLQGTAHDMIMSDLHSYPEWENEGNGRFATP